VHRQRGDDRVGCALGDSAARVRRPRRLRERGAGTLTLVLYGRQGCHLCDDARAALRRIGHPFEEVDIEADDELLRRYLERIPVVALDGEELSDYFVDEVALRARLEARVRGA
jgi:glutaredoxin